MMTDDTRPISKEEMREMFGETMPMEAVELLYIKDENTTVGELRRQLRELARRKRVVYDAIDRVDEIGLGFFEDADCTAEHLIRSLKSYADSKGIGTVALTIGIRFNNGNVGLIIEDLSEPREERTSRVERIHALRKEAQSMGYDVVPEVKMGAQPAPPGHVRQRIVRQAKQFPEPTRPGAELDNRRKNDE